MNNSDDNDDNINNKSINKKHTIDDYIVMRCMGKTTYGEIMLAKNKHDKKKYAIKMMSKMRMERVYIR